MRSRSIALAVAAVCLTVLTPATTRASSPGAKPRSSARPNIVVIQTDDQTADSLRFMPHVRALLQQEGTTFTNYFASYPLCCPSRATYLTGQYAHNHGVEHNSPPTGGFDGFRDQDTTFPVALQQSGYTTIHIGKYLNGYGLRDPLEVPPGWSDWAASVDPSTYRYYGVQLNDNGQLRTFNTLYQTDVYTRLAVDKIRAQRRRSTPFFLDLAYLAPHAVTHESSGPDPTGLDPADRSAVGWPNRRYGIRYPVPAPQDERAFAHVALSDKPAFNEADVSDKPAYVRNRPQFPQLEINYIRTNYRRRLQALLAVDRGVRQIVHALKETGKLDNTVIVFLSDNGFFHGEHRIPWGKYLAYEPSIHVPLVIRGPGVASDARSNALVSNVDIAPAILGLTGVSPLRKPDGHSLKSILRDPSHEAGRSAVLLESGPNPVGAPVYHGIRTNRYKLVNYESGEQELYDLERDRYELRNLAGHDSMRSIQQRLQRRLDQLQACRGAACRAADS